MRLQKMGFFRRFVDSIGCLKGIVIRSSEIVKLTEENIVFALGFYRPIMDSYWVILDIDVFFRKFLIIPKNFENFVKC